MPKFSASNARTRAGAKFIEAITTARPFSSYLNNARPGLVTHRLPAEDAETKPSVDNLHSDLRAFVHRPTSIDTPLSSPSLLSRSCAIVRHP